MAQNGVLFTNVDTSGVPTVLITIQNLNASTSGHPVTFNATFTVDNAMITSLTANDIQHLATGKVWLPFNDDIAGTFAFDHTHKNCKLQFTAGNGVVAAMAVVHPNGKVGGSGELFVLLEK